jgi:hypothetical protein
MWCILFFHDAAGYLHVIKQLKEAIRAAGKKSYTLVMGRPNSAKLANFPEVGFFKSELFSVSLSISADNLFFLLAVRSFCLCFLCPNCSAGQQRFFSSSYYTF